jgi:hypothetical protein
MYVRKICYEHAFIRTVGAAWAVVTGHFKQLGLTAATRAVNLHELSREHKMQRLISYLLSGSTMDMIR